MESRSLLRLARYHWMTVVVCAALGGLLGAVSAATSEREYTASSDVLVNVTGGSSTGEVAQSGNFSQQQARNFSAVATREAVLGPVIESLDLDLTVAQLRRAVSSSVPLNTSIISVSATDGSPDRAAAIANAVATTLAEIVPALTPRVEGESPVRVQVIESAVAPTNPSSPNTPLLVFLGLLGGLVVAVGAVVLRSAIGARVRSKEQVAEITGATLIGTVAFDRKAPNAPMALMAAPQSLRAEEYRQLRANIRFLQPGEQHKVFVFTSSMPGEGKSSTAANVSAALAASGLSVCLVEGDLRRPSLANVLDLPEGLGLTSVLTGEASLDDALRRWGPDGLSVLLAGDTPPNPSDLLESTAAGSLLSQIRDRFDVTIVDTPPLGLVSDSAVLARQLGGVILIAGLRRVRVRELRRAVERLAAVGAPIDGVALNLATGSAAGKYRYSYEPRTPQRRTRRAN